jgi:acetyl-CoA acetyltransferase
MPGIKLKNAALTRVGRHDADLPALVEAATGAVVSSDAPIEAVYLSSFAPAELCGIEDVAATVSHLLSSRFGIEAPLAGPYRTGGEALFEALEASGGREGNTLLIACEKMTHVPAGTAAGLLAPRVSATVEQQHGATLPAMAALATQSYMRGYGVPYHAFHHVARKNHDHAALNPRAHFRKRVSIETVAASPLVADPLRRHHCAPMSDGAAACILGHGDGPLRISGWGRGLDTPLFHERSDLGRFPAAARAARAAFDMAGRGPDAIDVVEIHDAFSPFELINLEEMGFYSPGTAWRALEAGQLHVGGALAVNPSGGMKARGHPIGVCGISSVFEMLEQLTGRAGDRQHPGAHRGLVQSAGGVSRDTYAFVMETAQ